MHKDIERRLGALERAAPIAEAARVFLHFADDEPPTYRIDGVAVGAGEWHERRHARALVIEVRHVEMLERV